MRRSLSSAIGGVVILFLLSPLLWAQDTPNDYRSAIAKLKLHVPEDPGARKYLGIQASSGKMSLSQIKSEIVLIQIFSMYCPPCQRHAPAANKLYQAIDSRKELKDRIKMIGIGMGNSQYEVEVFKDKYSPPFPLFDDRDSAIADLFTGIRTPYYIGLRNRTGSEPEIFYSKPGGFTNAEEFLDTIIVKASGIQLGGVQ
jgi:thiol-disulfide isomerase/thioredoxin